ncbi:bifunctional tetrahydrofolate synthase/dihydrofolate synthase [Nitrosovibrio sp. Nv17]|uniref:bifunctional tetrahydrofolate synthase/dihydrofolate synthase n=1 Tax=Nitrosovibrio sp. Nv17 TaxID=1855339 RepID=UPI000908B4AF|nr:bifunctional tetrahydrofolate synthase/dihydrofolate synthase [Nitrosovibrio sp. Nv17]SFW21957.1 dihydrofolate synthase / folylpolyglutamate synthase [Nitrosovibrio sp. Nv17]
MEPGAGAAGAQAALPATLEGWLAYLERLHPAAIDMGLARVARVGEALGLAPAFPIVTVGGTNGKGSVCAMAEAILACAGYRVGCYTSPHLLRYNERVRLGRREADDAALCGAFAAVEAARVRCGVTLTYFEFGTLAAMRLFVQAGVEAAILEVGLGGRLDAVNLFDADCAVLTGIDFDHMDYLGDTREAIGFEKAGIFRQGRPAVCADPDAPDSVLRHADSVGANLLRIGAEFGYSANAADAALWDYRGPGGGRRALPHPALRGACQLRNASACLAALGSLRERLPVTMGDIRRGLMEAALPGRFQVLPGRPATILDVAHNPGAARELADNLAGMGSCRRTYAVFAMLRDKDIEGVARALADRVDRWLIAGTSAPRGATADEVRQALAAAGIGNQDILPFPDVAAAYAAACGEAGEGDRICVFGSFHTVADVLRCRNAAGFG